MHKSPSKAARAHHDPSLWETSTYLSFLSQSCHARQLICWSTSLSSLIRSSASTNASFAAIALSISEAVKGGLKPLLPDALERLDKRIIRCARALNFSGRERRI